MIIVLEELSLLLAFETQSPTTCFDRDLGHRRNIHRTAATAGSEQLPTTHYCDRYRGCRCTRALEAAYTNVMQ